MGIQFIILVTPLKTNSITNTIFFCPDMLIHQSLKTPSNHPSPQDLFLLIPPLPALYNVGHLASPCIPHHPVSLSFITEDP